MYYLTELKLDRGRVEHCKFLETVVGGIKHVGDRKKSSAVSRVRLDVTCLT